MNKTQGLFTGKRLVKWIGKEQGLFNRKSYSRGWIRNKMYLFLNNTEVLKLMNKTQDLFICKCY